MQGYWVEAALLEGHLADVVAGALEDVHCAFERIEILPVHKDLADYGANELQEDQSFANLYLAICLEVLHHKLIHIELRRFTFAPCAKNPALHFPIIFLGVVALFHAMRD